uniref:hypothetical protein n=1 Tax=Fulvivirga sp. TaxID=1931237 RepID=UPI00404A34F3
MENIDKKLDEALQAPEKGYLSMSFEAKIRRKLAMNAVVAEQRNNVLVYIIAGLFMLPALIISIVLINPDALTSQIRLGGLALVACLVIVVFNFIDRRLGKGMLKDK